MKDLRMKYWYYILILIALFYAMTSFGQHRYEYHVMLNEVDIYTLKVGSCTSPDGLTTEIITPPSNYQYLYDNGYCLYNYPTTSVFTACFTFVAGSSSVTVNAGSSNSCLNVSFGSFTLYNSSCVQIATGLIFSGLTPGQSYTWCLTMRAWGGSSCGGFTTFCPYYTNNTNLPIELKEFTGVYNSDNYLSWTTATERDNDYFTLEHSIDGENWKVINTQSGSGTTNNEQTYSYIHRDYEPVINYYRLSQTDYDGTTEIFTSNIVAIDNRNSRYIIKYINSIGQEVSQTTSGLIFIVYSDGTIVKTYN